MPRLFHLSSPTSFPYTACFLQYIIHFNTSRRSPYFVLVLPHSSLYRRNLFPAYPFLLSLPACKSPISIVHTAVKNVIQLILSYSTSLFHQSYLHLKIYIVHHLFQYTPSPPRNKIHIKTNCCSFIDLLSQFQTHVQIYSTYHSHTFPCYTSSFTLLLYHLYFNLHT